MFDQTFVDTHAPTRKPWTVAASLLMQAGVTAILLLIPLMHPEMLHLNMEIPVWVPLKTAPKELPPPTTTAARSRTAPTFHLSALTPPTSIPRHISMEPDAPQFSVLMTVGPVANAGSAGLPGLSDTLPGYTAPPSQPQPPVKRAEIPKGPTHVSSGVQAAKLIFGPAPAYPALARTARVQGTVRIQAVIAPSGAIENLNVMSGPPLLVAAALGAVKQWRYQPTLLNGQAVEVATEIDVNFTLGQQ